MQMCECPNGARDHAFVYWYHPEGRVSVDVTSRCRRDYRRRCWYLVRAWVRLIKAYVITMQQRSFKFLSQSEWRFSTIKDRLQPTRAKLIYHWIVKFGPTYLLKSSGIGFGSRSSDFLLIMMAANNQSFRNIVMFSIIILR